MKRKFLFVEEKKMKPFFKQRGGNETVKKGCVLKTFLRNTAKEIPILKRVL